MDRFKCDIIIVMLLSEEKEKLKRNKRKRKRQHIENVYSSYCPPSAHTTLTDWDQIFNIARRKTIIAGDLNGHHTNWSTRTDSRGDQILDSILDNNFVSLNDCSHTRIKLVNGTVQKSAPDLSLASLDIALKFDWIVLNENLGSDHLMIKIKTNIGTSNIYKRKRNFKKADWLQYKSRIESKLKGFILPDDHQSAYDALIDIINEVADKCISLIKICENPLHQQKFTPRPYWNPDISKAVAERRRALAVFRRNPTPVNLEALQNKVSSKNIMDAVGVIQDALVALNSMIADIGLNISHRKTKVCVFTRGHSRNSNSSNITLNTNNECID
ncbi:unnamed protein product [Parnassius apollo]|uniref:(apollo) hypothetical protein n=1 Tax=Parnassius apollo TaxID=110799 RepID=A0A8S3X6E9_PARAO|nr:unnamed protein product [Parnassius apollo]